MQLKVLKADGISEEYLHTKVIGTISKALDAVGDTDICISQELAEVVTYFLYHKSEHSLVSSSEILSIVQVVLAETGYQAAAEALSEHHYHRRLKRSRLEVVSLDVQQLSDAQKLCRRDELTDRRRWDKSVITEGLVKAHSIKRQTARAIASMVEEKIFSLDVTLIPVSLIKQLVLSDTAFVLGAMEQLQSV